MFLVVLAGGADGLGAAGDIGDHTGTRGYHARPAARRQLGGLGSYGVLASARNVSYGFRHLGEIVAGERFQSRHRGIQVLVHGLLEMLAPQLHDGQVPRAASRWIRLTLLLQKSQL